MPHSCGAGSRAPSSRAAVSGCSDAQARLPARVLGIGRLAGAHRRPLRRLSRVPVHCRPAPRLGARRSSSCSRSSVRRAASTSAPKAGRGTRRACRRGAACLPATSRRASSRSCPAASGSSSMSRTARRPARISTSSAIASASPRTPRGARRARCVFVYGRIRDRVPARRRAERDVDRHVGRCARAGASVKPAANDVAQRCRFVVAERLRRAARRARGGRRGSTSSCSIRRSSCTRPSRCTPAAAATRTSTCSACALVRPGGVLATFSCSGPRRRGAVPEDRRRRRRRRESHGADTRAAFAAGRSPRRDRISRGGLPERARPARSLRSA